MLIRKIYIDIFNKALKYSETEPILPKPTTVPLPQTETITFPFTVPVL